MSITQKFDDIPYELVRGMRPGNRDGHAMGQLMKLYDVSSPCPSSTYARSSWGYTILRTTYTEESNASLPLALEKLQRWITQFWLHLERFPFWGQKGEGRQKLDGSLNEELGRRLCFEVVEDKDDPRLNLPRLNEATHEDVKALVERFNDWVTSVGENPAAENPLTPRFCDFLVIDEDALHDLARLPDETPPLRLAHDLQEKRKWRGDGSAFVWFLDSSAIRDYRDSRSSQCRGWMKVDISDLEETWFTRASRLDSEGILFVCKESSEKAGEFWYDGLPTQGIDP